MKYLYFSRVNHQNSLEDFGEISKIESIVAFSERRKQLCHDSVKDSDRLLGYQLYVRYSKGTVCYRNKEFRKF